MTKIEQFCTLWLAMSRKERMDVLRFLTEGYGLNLLKTCRKLMDELDKKRDKR